MSAWLRDLVLAALVALLPSAAAAQSIVTASSTPSPFVSGATITITITASLTPGASPESWCFPHDFCHIVAMQPFPQVAGSNGYVAGTEDWSAQWQNPGPGQTGQPVTYTVGIERIVWPRGADRDGTGSGTSSHSHGPIRTWGTGRAGEDRRASPGSAVVGQTVTGQGFGTAWGGVTVNQTPAQPTAWTRGRRATGWGSRW